MTASWRRHARERAGDVDSGRGSLFFFVYVSGLSCVCVWTWLLQRALEM